MNPAMAPTGGASSDSPPVEALLSLSGFTKSFGAVEALKDVDFSVEAGEVVGLVGDNGAGKSTLIKAIAGVQPVDTGTAYFNGKEVALGSPTAATRLGIATVYQDLALCENLDVVENLFLGQELVAGLPPRRLDETAMEQKANELLDSLGVTTLRSVRTEVGMLSGGQRQAVAIARSLLGDPKVVLLDEPTAALGVVQTEQILKLVKRLKDRGLGVVVISHNLGDLFQIVDRISVLRLGRVARTFGAGETDEQAVVAAITGADIERKTEENPL